MLIYLSMDMELLYWATKLTGDTSYRDRLGSYYGPDGAGYRERTTRDRQFQNR